MHYSAYKNQLQQHNLQPATYAQGLLYEFMVYYIIELHCLSNKYIVLLNEPLAAEAQLCAPQRRSAQLRPC